MRKSYLAILIIALLSFCLVDTIYAMCGMCPGDKGKEEAAEAVNVGNKICPVSGEEIEEGEVNQVEHEGKIYNLCCKMCEKDFKKDPQKYIEKLKESEAKEEKEGHKEGQHEEHHHS